MLQNGASIKTDHVEAYLPRPHFGRRVEDDQGRLLQRIDPGNARRFRIRDDWRQAIMDGLKGAASEPGGTSTGVFEGWNHDRFPVFGKTGTAQRTGKAEDFVVGESRDR